MKLAIGNDHTGVEMKLSIVGMLTELGHEVINVGTDSDESYPYPVSGYRVGRLVADGEADLGILICGTGIGISLAANKVKGIRACPCTDPYTARLCRQHNDSNILCLGARITGSEMAKEIVREWLDARFEGGRHQERLDILSEIEDGREIADVAIHE